MTDSWSPINSVDLGFEGTVNEVSKPEEGLSENGKPESEEERFSEVDELRDSAAEKMFV